MRALILSLCVSLVAGGAAAEVVETRETGFRLSNTAVVAGVGRAEVWRAFGEIARWWDPAHTYSGDAANLTLALEPGACFCEALPGGGVEHGRVVLAWPDQGTLRLNAALGPLQSEGVSAALTFEVRAREDGGMEIVQTYNVGGAASEMVAAAPLIDQVLAIQLQRLARYVETGAPE